jgi:hypothetical protein
MHFEVSRMRRDESNLWDDGIVPVFMEGEE